MGEWISSLSYNILYIHYYRCTDFTPHCIYTTNNNLLCLKILFTKIAYGVFWFCLRIYWERRSRSSLFTVHFQGAVPTDAVKTASGCNWMDIQPYNQSELFTPSFPLRAEAMFVLRELSCEPKSLVIKKYAIANIRKVPTRWRTTLVTRQVLFFGITTHG